MKKIILAVSLSLASMYAVAADPLDNLPPGAKVLHKFDSAASGYRGVLFEVSGKKRVFYATPDSKFVISGVLYDAAGNNITTQDLLRAQQLGALNGGGANVVQKAPPGIDMDTAWLAASKSNGFTEGSGDRVVYVYFDANCPYCHKLWTNTRTLTKGAKVIWVPVAGLRPDSLNKGAELITSPTVKTMQSIADKTIAGVKTVSSDMADKMEFNMGAMAMTGSTQFPTILFTEKGQKKIVVGLPAAKDLETIFGK